jgi:hypothetical protein
MTRQMYDTRLQFFMVKTLVERTVCIMLIDLEKSHAGDKQFGTQ